MIGNQMYIVIDNANNYKCWGTFESREKAEAFGDANFSSYKALYMDDPATIREFFFSDSVTN